MSYEDLAVVDGEGGGRPRATLPVGGRAKAVRVLVASMKPG